MRSSWPIQGFSTEREDYTMSERLQRMLDFVRIHYFWIGLGGLALVLLGDAVLVGLFAGLIKVIGASIAVVAVYFLYRERYETLRAAREAREVEDDASTP
jgi:uncharacterized membrane protein